MGCSGRPQFIMGVCSALRSLISMFNTSVNKLSPTAEETQQTAGASHGQGAPPRRGFPGRCIASSVGLCVGRDGTLYSPARLSLSSLSFPPYLWPCLSLRTCIVLSLTPCRSPPAALSLTPSFLCHISHLCVVVCGAVPLVTPHHTHTHISPLCVVVCGAVSLSPPTPHTHTTAHRCDHVPQLQLCLPTPPVLLWVQTLLLSLG